jgi:hypothetical protein
MGRPSADAEVELRVYNAKARIERAQNELSAACADLSAIVGAITNWGRASKLSSACKALWYRLDGCDRTRWKWKLDGMHGDARAAAVAAAEAAADAIRSDKAVR